MQNTETGTTTYSYDAVGNLASVAQPNGVVHAYTYNPRNQLTDLSVGAPLAAPVASYAYTLDATGRRTSVAELTGRTVTYVYDNLYRLTGETIAGDPSATPQNGTISYTYDAVGNRTQMQSTVPAIPAGLFFYDSNDRLSTDAYDAGGNTTGSGGVTYTYDFENRIIGTNTNISITHNGDGQRVRKVVGSTTTTYLVDELNPTGYAQVLVETIQAPGFVAAQPRQYVYGLDLVSQRRFIPSCANCTVGSFEVRYYAYDGHGSVRQLTDPAGAVTDTYTYDAFGNLTSSTGTTPNHYLYAGEQFDEDLNLYYNRARYLDVRTGRFWSMDAYEGGAQSPASLHKYLYAGADPMNLLDPSGNISLGEIATSFSVQAILIRAGIGATIGAIDSALAGTSVTSGALQGAVLAAVAPKIPGKVFFFLGAYGIFDALRNEQYAAAAFRFSLFGIGVFAQTRGFQSFSAFKRVFGRAGPGKSWHHIVEQTPENLARFGQENIHNPQNIAAVKEGAGLTHRKITGFYQSKQPRLTGSPTLTVREWLNTMSFQEQYTFGLETLQRFGGGGPINLFGILNPWVWPSVLEPFGDGDDDEQPPDY